MDGSKGVRSAEADSVMQVGGWPDKVMSVSNVPFDEHTCIPHTMTLEDIEHFKTSFVAAVHRALKAGFDVRTLSLSSRSPKSAH